MILFLSLFSPIRMLFKQFLILVFGLGIIGIQGQTQNNNDGMPTQEEIESFLRSLDRDNTRSDVFLRALNFPEIRSRMHRLSPDQTVQPRFSNRNK